MRTNGALKVATVVLSGLVLVLAGALANSYAKASNHVSRIEAQAMVDRGDKAVKELVTIRLESIEAKIDTLVAAQGGK